MLKTTKTFECDECGKRQSVNPFEFTPHGKAEDILVDQYGWMVIAPSSDWPMQPGQHHCDDCRE